MLNKFIQLLILTSGLTLLLACGVSTTNIDATDEVSEVKEVTEIVNTATPLPAKSTVVPTVTVTDTLTEDPTPEPIEPTVESTVIDDKANIEFGLGGLAKDLESWAAVKLPKFITASHVNISDIAYVSKFRSSAGHDFSDSFEVCCSMKHYFIPIDYFGTRFTQPIYSPVDGVVLYLSEPTGGYSDDWKIEYREQTGKEPPADYRDWNIYIRPDNAPNIWITHMHVNPLDEIIKKVPPTSGQQMMMGTSRPAIEGYRVKAGDLIGYGLAEIIVKRHLDGAGIPSGCNSADSRQGRGARSPGCKATVQLHSIFEFMTDELFGEYQKIADVSKSDFVITADDRARNPLVCEGENFADRGNSDDPEVYVKLQDPTPTNGSSSNSEVSGTLPGFTELSSGRDIIASFESSGSQTISTFDADQSYILVVASSGGPLDVFITDNDGKRGIFSRPLSNGVYTYETVKMDPGQIGVSVEANDDITWQIVAVKAE